jgi:hypothetical protein
MKCTAIASLLLVLLLTVAAVFVNAGVIVPTGEQIPEGGNLRYFLCIFVLKKQNFYCK